MIETLMIAEPHALNISVTRIVLPYPVYTFVGIRISILYRLALWLGGKEWLIQMKTGRRFGAQDIGKNRLLSAVISLMKYGDRRVISWH